MSTRHGTSPVGSQTSDPTGGGPHGRTIARDRLGQRGARRAHRRRARRRAAGRATFRATTRPGSARSSAAASSRVARVAIERPERAAGRPAAGRRHRACWPIHPNQLAAARDRFRAAAGKSDRFDAFVLAELARTDMHRFPALAPDRDETNALRALARTREDLVAAARRARQPAARPARRLLARRRADLRRRRQPDRARVPGALPQPRRRPRPGRPSAWPGSWPATATAADAPPPSCSSGCAAPRTAALGELEHEARRAAVLGLVAALRPIVEQISQLTSQIAGAIRTHPDGPIFLSLFRDPKSVITAAGLLAEIGDNRARYPTDDSLAADAGQAPVAKRVRQAAAASFRWACDKRLRNPSPSSPTAPATGTPGPTTSTNAPAPAAATTPTPSASSAAPGPASSGAAGKTTSPTTPPATATSPASSHQG